MVRIGISVMLMVLAGCGTALPVATTEPPDVDQATAMLQQHGWQPVGVLDTATVRIGDPEVVPEHVWELYLEASREVGLDFGPLRGQEATLTRVDLGGPRASVLSMGSDVVGAWIFPGGTGGCVPGIFPLSASRADVESCQ